MRSFIGFSLAWRFGDRHSLGWPPRSRRTPIRRANGGSMRCANALLHRHLIGMAIRRSPLLGGGHQGAGGLRSAEPMVSRWGVRMRVSIGISLAGRFGDRHSLGVKLALCVIGGRLLMIGAWQPLPFRSLAPRSSWRRDRVGEWASTSWRRCWAECRFCGGR